MKTKKVSSISHIHLIYSVCSILFVFAFSAFLFSLGHLYIESPFQQSVFILCSVFCNLVLYLLTFLYFYILPRLTFVFCTPVTQFHLGLICKTSFTSHLLHWVEYLQILCCSCQQLSLHFNVKSKQEPYALYRCKYRVHAQTNLSLTF